MISEGVNASSVSECVSSMVAEAFTASFEGYLLPINVDAEAYERRFRADDLDPFASRVYFRDETPAGILLVGRRGWTSRIAAMGVVPGERGKGLGKKIMREAIQDAKKRGDHSVVLEVFEQNEPAVKLYEGLGFRARQRLFGYHLEHSSELPQTSDEPSEMDPLELARIVAREGDSGLPWMLSAESLSAATLPARAYRLGHHAFALVGDTQAETLVLGSLVVPQASRRRGWGTRMLNALRAAFPWRDWTIPQIVPEDLADAFLRRLGWRRLDLNQFEMRLDLEEKGGF